MKTGRERKYFCFLVIPYITQKKEGEREKEEGRKEKKKERKERMEKRKEKKKGKEEGRKEGRKEKIEVVTAQKPRTSNQIKMFEDFLKLPTNTIWF